MEYKDTMGLKRDKPVVRRTRALAEDCAGVLTPMSGPSQLPMTAAVGSEASGLQGHCPPVHRLPPLYIHVIKQTNNFKKKSLKMTRTTFYLVEHLTLRVDHG